MERLLIALDCTPECLKILHYLVRVLKGAQNCEFVLFHILPTASPDKLRKEEVHRIERIHADRADLAGYFWKEEDEKKMNHSFSHGREVLVLGGFPEDRILSHFGVESGDIADIILAQSRELECSTLVMGRRRISRVKEFLLGSVSASVVKMARGSSVWVIDD